MRDHISICEKSVSTEDGPSLSVLLTQIYRDSNSLLSPFPQHNRTKKLDINVFRFFFLANRHDEAKLGSLKQSRALQGI